MPAVPAPAGPDGASPSSSRRSGTTPLAGLSSVLASGTGERYSPEVAALLLGAWAIATLAVGAISLHRRDP
jgi:hypothetical protein